MYIKTRWELPRLVSGTVAAPIKYWLNISTPTFEKPNVESSLAEKKCFYIGMSVRHHYFPVTSCRHIPLGSLCTPAFLPNSPVIGEAQINNMIGYKG